MNDKLKGITLLDESGKAVEYVRKDSIPEITLPEGDFAPYEIGESYHVETVTKYFLGRLVGVTDQELIFSECAWIPDTGRYNKYMAGDKPNECEPYPKSSLVIIGRGALVSCVRHSLFLEVR